jgi:alanine racemase
MMTRSTSVFIDLAAIGDNITALKRSLKESRFMAVVKADAYGHGAVSVARHIEKMVDAYAVAFTEEAVELRTAGIIKPILILEGPHSENDVAIAAKQDLWPAVHDLRQIEWCRAHQRPLSHIWIKIDTGMHRLGFAPEQLHSVQQSLEGAGCRRLTLMSHLASAEFPDSSITTQQLNLWRQIVSDWPSDVSLCNSAASRLGLATKNDWARVGYAMYGGLVKDLSSNSELKPAMRFETAVLAVRRIATGEAVGYGGHWIARRDSLIATLPVGYGDGYPWAAQNGTPIEINGSLAPLVGRVSMDMLTVDVTDCDDVGIGTRAILWGHNPGVDEVAAASGTIGYELMTRMTGRATRCYEE